MNYLSHLFFSTDGRINRADWWFGQFVIIVCGVLLTFITHVGIPHTLSFAMFSLHNITIGAILGIVVLWSHISLNTKRLHDMNLSGWWIIPLYIPILGYLVGFVVLGCIEGGSTKDNEYGPPTKWK